MAGNSPPHSGLAFLCTLVLCIHLACASTTFGFNFSIIETSPCSNDLECRGDASFANKMIELTRNDISSRSGGSQGRVWYAKPVPLWDAATAELASFTTTFDFKITPDKSYMNPDGTNKKGDGMAFFLGPYSADVNLSSGSGGGSLGLFNSSNNGTSDSSVVAVEFDTFSNPGWDNYTGHQDHVGIDVNSIRSVASTDKSVAGDKLMNLTSDLMMTARINYDNRTKLLGVDLDINGSSYHVNHTVDLKLVLPEKVAVGFSATTGWASELHRVSFWTFDSTLEEKAVPPPRIKSEPSTNLVFKVLAPILAVSVCAALGILLWLRQRRRRHVQLQPNNGAASDGDSSDQENDEADFERGVVGPRRYHYRELATATGDFSDENRLGRGGFGSVYRGNMKGDDGGDGKQVAVKKFSSETSSQGRKEFEAEVKIISRLRHRNLVQLLGWCDSSKGLLLVYELVSEGSLDKHIHNNNTRFLTWSERYDSVHPRTVSLEYSFHLICFTSIIDLQKFIIIGTRSLWD
jgi:nitrate reductase NapE component